MVAVKRFDSYIKKTISNELKYFMRSRKNRAKKVITFSDLGEVEISQQFYEEPYVIGLFKKKISTREFDVIISDELLYEALLRIDPKIREIVLLKFWGRFTDKEVAEFLGFSRQTVTYKKNIAVKLLREIIKELRKNDARFVL